MALGIKAAVSWLVDNDDLTDIIANDYNADEFSPPVSFAFCCDMYGLSEQELANKIRREIQKRGW